MDKAMKGFGRLILILGLSTVAFIVYTHAWNTAFGKGPLADIAEDMENNAAKVRRIVKEAEEDRKNREKNSGESKKPDNTNIEKSISDTQYKKERSQKNKDNKSEENAKTSIVDSKKYPVNTQYKDEETNNEVVPGLLPGLENDSIDRSSKRRRKREDPFKDVVLRTTSEETHGGKVESLEKQSVADTSKSQSIKNKAPFVDRKKVPKATISKLRNNRYGQKQTSELIDQISPEESLNTDIIETMK
jgi:hypothetical protein